MTDGEYNYIHANKANQIDRMMNTLANESYRYSKDKLELCELVKLGCHPCVECGRDPNKCSDNKCIAWIEWFALKWQNIQAAARQKGWNG